jgi:alanyl-tRNA synthetase
MEYRKTETGFAKLPQHNVDFGGGFERILAAGQDEPDIFKTDLFQPLVDHLEQISGQSYQGLSTRSNLLTRNKATLCADCCAGVCALPKWPGLSDPF